MSGEKAASTVRLAQMRQQRAKKVNRINARVAQMRHV
jgi:hypothetical protein